MLSVFDDGAHLIRSHLNNSSFQFNLIAKKETRNWIRPKEQRVGRLQLVSCGDRDGDGKLRSVGGIKHQSLNLGRFLFIFSLFISFKFWVLYFLQLSERQHTYSKDFDEDG